MTATPPALQTRRVATGLGELLLRVGGTGPAILFWPSLLMDGRMWLAQADYFIGRGYRVVLIDPPGAGGSAPLTRPFSFDECAQCIVQILDALEIERAHWVGNSWGGMIGGTFAAWAPQRIGVAVLMNATASPAGLRHRLEFPLLARVTRALGGIRWPLTETVIDAFVGPTTRRTRPQVVAHIRESLARVDTRSSYWAVTSVVPQRPDQRPRLATIRTPVLVVAGAEDRVFPVADAREMAAAIPGAQLDVLAGAAHLAGLECPERVNPMIEAFIKEHADA
ncbi:alpha/beta fold hydrolase [Solimonas marina]|uniref:Alpha/beta fold hydrolase n=1 Tax=Solimonas marina TaxID=2714601 RepID=A0A969WFT9_9GAMM|nr:alpha/beta hydrolase [Solimonas marina]NKF23940.1 alpha/beta fold hydrolase [Solimonas marina]